MQDRGSRNSQVSRTRRRLRVLLTPGIGLKRWLALAIFGAALLLLGITLGLGSVTDLSLDLTDRAIGYGRTLTFAHVLPVFWRSVLFGSLGALVFAVGAFEVYRTLLSGATYARRGDGLIENLSARRVRRRGPRIVAIGGGTGLSTLLRGLKHHTENLTAIVTVADDGGSSGRLREELGISPPGDARQCLIALSDSEPELEQAMSYRFDRGGDLQGHSMGNLLLAALAHDGDLHEALQAAARLLALKGKVVPSTRAADIVLKAETEAGGILTGESAISSAHEPIVHLWVEPRDAVPNSAALDAINAADAIIIGPGSLYTSILPNFLIRGISQAVEASLGAKIFVCNIATQEGETDGFNAADHLRVFESQAEVRITHLLANASPQPIAPEYRQDPILPDEPQGFGGEFVVRDIVDAQMPSRHDPGKLALALLPILRAGAARRGARPAL